MICDTLACTYDETIPVLSISARNFFALTEFVLGRKVLLTRIDFHRSSSREPSVDFFVNVELKEPARVVALSFFDLSLRI